MHDACKVTDLTTGITHPHLSSVQNEQRIPGEKLSGCQTPPLFLIRWGLQPQTTVCRHHGLLILKPGMKQTLTQSLAKHKAPHVLGAAVKHTGWRNRVPRAVSFPRMGWLQALCLLLGCSSLGKERAVRSVALTEFLLLRKKHREWGRMVPPALCLALTVKAAICTLKSNKSKYKFWHVLTCVFH